MTRIAPGMQVPDPHAETPHVGRDDKNSSQAATPPPACNPVEALGQLNAELGQLRDTQPNSALYRAHSLRPQLFGDGHKNAFLHTEKYDVKAATDRMTSYWEARAGLFGEKQMLLPMDRISSLKSEDSLALEQGFLQLLRHRDSKGRGLIFLDLSRHDPKLGYPIESMLRVVWYVMHVAMEDPVIRANGFVIIVHPKDSSPEQIHPELIVRTAIIGSVIPLRWKGLHICHPCTSYNKYFPLVKMLAPSEMKDNMVVHFGTGEHVLECLADYGMCADRIPTALGGTVELDYSKWLLDRREFEGGSAGKVSPLYPEADRLESSDAVMEDESVTPQGSTKAAELASAASATSPHPVTKKPKAKPRKRTAAASSSSAATAPSPLVLEADAPKSSSAAASKAKRPGRKGDDRMHRAVTLKIEQPDVPLVEALQWGGFNFDGLNEKGKPHHEVFDQDHVSLMQRKNQLLRRIRMEKKKKKEEAL